MGKMSRPKLWLLLFGCASPLIALDPHQPIRQLYQHRLTSVGSKTPEADASRPDLLGLVATRVERLEIRPDDRQG
jgi:hypothetical protein